MALCSNMANRTVDYSFRGQLVIVRHRRGITDRFHGRKPIAAGAAGLWSYNARGSCPVSMHRRHRGAENVAIFQGRRTRLRWGLPEAAWQPIPVIP